MADKKKIKTKQQTENEVVVYNDELAPWQGSARNYKPYLSEDFKKRHKIDVRAEVLEKVSQYSGSPSSKSTSNFTKKFSSPAKTEKQKLAEKYRAKYKKKIKQLKSLVEKQEKLLSRFQDKLRESHKSSQNLEKQLQLIESKTEDKAIPSSEKTAIPSDNALHEELTNLRTENARLTEENKRVSARLLKYAKNQQFTYEPGDEVAGCRGRYRIEEEFKSGGMGWVYLARCLASETMVVIKVIPPISNEDNRRNFRFMQEAQTLLRLQHENIVKGIDFCQGADGAFLVMEYLKGPTVEELLTGDTFIPVEQTVPIILDIAKALLHLEELGAVHRDIKPSNILITEEGIAKLMDLGIVKFLHAQYSLTTSGIIMGTPYYLSPEQATDGEVDIKSDIYSLGITFFHMLAGTLPFQGQDYVEVISKRLTLNPPKVTHFNSRVPRRVANLIEKMMSRKASKRPSPAKVVEKLELIASNL